MSRATDLAMQARHDSRTCQPLFSARKRLFMASLLFAFLFPALTWKQAAGCALLLLLFNTLILPWLDLGVTDSVSSRSPGHRARTGIVLYPISVLVLVVLYRHHLHIAAAAWAIMALGDGMATVVGEALRGSALPWNRQKTWSGFISFAVAGTVGAYVLARWIAPEIPPDKTLMVCA